MCAHCYSASCTAYRSIFFFFLNATKYVFLCILLLCVQHADCALLWKRLNLVSSKGTNKERLSIIADCTFWLQAFNSGE